MKARSHSNTVQLVAIERGGKKSRTASDRSEKMD